MSSSEQTQLRAMLAAHANIIAINAKLHRMVLANENARSLGKEDVHSEQDFLLIEQEASNYAKELTEQ